MSAIFGFTFHMGRMTEVLTPDIYRAHWCMPSQLDQGLTQLVKGQDINVEEKKANCLL